VKYAHVVAFSGKKSKGFFSKKKKEWDLFLSSLRALLHPLHHHIFFFFFILQVFFLLCFWRFSIQLLSFFQKQKAWCLFFSVFLHFLNKKGLVPFFREHYYYDDLKITQRK
jgi:hypothetical protein